ncbi:MAG TPA: 30S ribosomal protein S18 [Acidimicrobiales bacterium]|nr:30S ribosomal protein S18 [Acidimicrobiales bacterium]
MARNSKVAKKTSSRKPRPTEGKGRLRRGRPKVCRFCSEHTVWVDYKDVNVLARFLNDRGRIKARAATGTCAQHQRDVAVAIKTARELVLLPYAVRTMSADPSDRRGGGRRGPGRPAPSAETEASQEGGSEMDTVAADGVEDGTADEAVDRPEADVADDGQLAAETAATIS